jgi:sulfatase maturation enzyme AslB (radical SAM superfamily)
MDQLQSFRHVDIGISVESWGKLNERIRQGSNTDAVLANIERYLDYRDNEHIYVVLRTVPSALSIHQLDKLYQWAINKKLDVMSSFLQWPPYMAIEHLPEKIKSKLIDQYSQWVYSDKQVVGHDRNPHNYREHIDNEIRALLECLKKPADPTLTSQLYFNLAKWEWFNDEDIRNYFF